jgi:hypothetical protein
MGPDGVRLYSSRSAHAGRQDCKQVTRRSKRLESPSPANSSAFLLLAAQNLYCYSPPPPSVTLIKSVPCSLIMWRGRCHCSWVALASVHLSICNRFLHIFHIEFYLQTSSSTKDPAGCPQAQSPNCLSPFWPLFCIMDGLLFSPLFIAHVTRVLKLLQVWT